MNNVLIAIAISSFFVPYFILYKEDPLALFRIQRRASWSSVLASIGLSARAREKRSRLWLLLVGSVTSYLLGFADDSWGAVLGGSLLLLLYVVMTKPVPFSKKEIALPYPRQGRASFEAPKVKGSSDGPAVDVSELRLFYVSYRNALLFSLPEGKVPIPDLLASFLEQSRPDFAWVQIIFRRASVHRYLEAQRWRLVRERELLAYRGASQSHLSHLERMIKKIDEMLSSDLFAVAVRGVLIGADPMSIALGYSDEVDSLAVFETKDPGLLYEMARRQLRVYIPSQRAEPPFFFSRDLRLIASPPTASKTAPLAPLGLEVLQGWEESPGEGSLSEAVELSPIPAVDEKYHFFPEGSLELVYDGRLHVLAGGLYGRALSASGSGSYQPIEALRQKITRKAIGSGYMEEAAFKRWAHAFL